MYFSTFADHLTMHLTLRRNVNHRIGNKFCGATESSTGGKPLGFVKLNFITTKRRETVCPRFNTVLGK